MIVLMILCPWQGRVLWSMLQKRAAHLTCVQEAKENRRLESYDTHKACPPVT